MYRKSHESGTNFEQTPNKSKGLFGILVVPLGWLWHCHDLNFLESDINKYFSRACFKKNYIVYNFYMYCITVSAVYLTVITVRLCLPKAIGVSWLSQLRPP